MKFCENCNKEFNDDLNFCPICGAKLSTNEEKIKFCPICGKELDEDANFCPACGNPTTKPDNESYFDYDNYRNHTERPQGIGIIMAFMIISCCIYGLSSVTLLAAGFGATALIYLIPLCWQIPMTAHFSNCANAGLKVSTAFKVCTLLFVSIISGIIMLCNKDL